MEEGIMQNNTSTERKHFPKNNEMTDFNITSKSDLPNVMEVLNTKGSKVDSGCISQPISQSTVTTVMNTKDNEIGMNSNSEDVSNYEVVTGDDQGNHSISPRSKDENVGTNSDVSHPKEYDPSIDERLPDTVTLLTTPEGGKLYLVGTAHFSVESQNDVSMIIQAVQPHLVVVELCKARTGVLQLSEELMYHYAMDFKYRRIAETFREYGLHNGLLQMLLLQTAARVSQQLGMAPGGEFRRAFEEAQKIPGCIMLLGDRPIHITIQRAVRSLSWWQAIRLAWDLIVMSDEISKEDVELCKQRSLLDEMISKLQDGFPSIEKIFIRERDVYLTHSLQLACLPENTPDGKIRTDVRVVGIVGIGHTPGIIENWGKVKSSDIPPIMSIPPQALSTKILTFTIKASLLSAVLYTAYKIIPLPSSATLHSIKSSVEGLLKIMVSMEASTSPDEYEHSLPSVMYVVNNIPGPGIDIVNFEAEYTVGCSCTGKCSDCSCTRGSPNYIDGRISDEKLTGPIIECNSYCTCNEKCDNRLVQNGPVDSLVTSEIDNKGLGLLTSKFIRKNQFICEYAGEVIGIDEAKRRIEANKRNNDMNYVLVVNEHIGDRTIVTCIDPKYFGNIGRYCNHSCEPNASLIPIRVEGVVPRLCLFASRDIEIGEEVTFNYAGVATNPVQDLSDTPCLCGSKNCLGYLPHNPI